MTDAEEFTGKMRAAGDVLAKCVGGGNDGETILLRPQGSIGPPIRLSFVDGYMDGSVRWSTYEMSLQEGWFATWPDVDTVRTYYFVDSALPPTTKLE